MATLDNRLRAINFQVQSFLGLEKQDNNENFELVKEWDFTRLDFDSLKKDFRTTPPWGEKFNKLHSCKYNESNIKLSSEGIEFWNSVNTGSDNKETPYVAGAIVTKKATTLPAFGKIETLVEIPRYKGQFPAFWTTDELATMPEFDVFEFIWPSWKEEATIAGNIHYGTAYNSKKWKFDNPSWLGISGKTWDKPIKFSAEFYPHETLYKVNNYVVYKTTRGYSPNNKVVWLNGGTYRSGGGPIGEGPWLSLKAKYLKFYKLKE
jgi:hypothetical protein